MSLRQHPQVSPRMIAANRANAQKSTGPRTGRGKGQVALNALKHGGYARRLFRSNLLKAREDVALYDWILISDTAMLDRRRKLADDWLGFPASGGLWGAWLPARPWRRPQGEKRA